MAKKGSTKKQVAAKEPEVVKADVVEPTHERPTVTANADMPFPVREGNLHAVKFRGKWLQWTHGTIQAMSKGDLMKEIEFPPNSEYEHAAELSKCRDC